MTSANITGNHEERRPPTTESPPHWKDFNRRTTISVA